MNVSSRSQQGNEWEDNEDIMLLDDILVSTPSANNDIRSRFRAWLASFLRMRPIPFWGWSYILPVLQVDVAQLEGFLFSWTDTANLPPLSFFINGEYVELQWNASEKRTALIPKGLWHRYENIIATKAPINWSKLKIQPVISQSWADQGLVDSQERDHLNASCVYPYVPGHPEVAIERAIEFMVNSVNSDFFSGFQGLCYGCYDLTSEGFRLSSWVWTNGIVISALTKTRRDDLISLAAAIADSCLRFQIETGHNTGALMIRHDPVSDVPQGYAQWLAPNDAALFGGYGLLSLFSATNDTCYLDAAVGIADWITRVGIKNGKLRVGYRLEQKRWDDSWLYVDAGFTPVLFSRLYAIEPRSEWKQASALIMDDLLGRLYGGNGRLFSAWLWPGRKGRHLFARGYAWFLDGLIHAHRCTGSNVYLQVAVECAEVLQKYQCTNGAWNYLLDKSETGFCNKGTPAIAWQLLNLYQITSQDELRDSARCALDWCADNQYFGEDDNAQGGIVSWNSEGAIVGAKNIQTAFPYASGFQILAELLWREL